MVSYEPQLTNITKMFKIFIFCQQSFEINLQILKKMSNFEDFLSIKPNIFKKTLN